jgi:Tfp pilus assembly protein PilX
MLTPVHPRRRRHAPPLRQQGIVLLVALVVLIGMTLAGLSLLRSVFTSNRVAGNLAFQQAATQSADVGVETAIAWLESNNDGTALHQSRDAADGELGYFARREDPGPGQSWEDFWQQVLVNSKRVNKLPPDAAGNTIEFVIHRLCNAVGDPLAGARCELSPQANSEGNSQTALSPAFSAPQQQYYRITARVTGPRNTLSYVQVVVAM